MEANPIRISDTVKTNRPTELPFADFTGRMQARLQLLYELPLQFASESDLGKLYDLILHRVVDLIEGAHRGTLMVLDPVSGKLALRAAIPQDDPPISRTLVQRAITEEGGFIWSATDDVDVSQSVRNYGIKTGMYAALMWHGSPVGVLSVDNPERGSAFDAKDLKFLMAVGHYAASAIANHLLRHDIEQSNRTLQHLLASFSPKLRGTLMDHAKAGRLRPGGKKSDVTILFSDLRGFTRTTTELGTDAVVEMLNEYFSALVDAIFKHDGTVDKFMGDAILAVFGSPEADPLQHQKAAAAALEMRDAMNTINSRRRAEGKAACDIGIGIHCGEVLHGFIGADERMEFTVIGDAVNMASRLCSAAESGQVLASGRLAGLLDDTVVSTAVSISTKHNELNQAFDLNRPFVG